MLYRTDKKGEKLSQLGYGCMRFSKKGASIDLEKTEKEIMYAYENGVNYFDTAYIYPGSEEALGKILEKNGIREKVRIATKLPQYIMKTPEAIEKTFNEELKRLRTDYIDYYLMHMFTDVAQWENIKKLGIEDFIERHKADGSIKNIGFSFHGNSEMFIKILHAYDWDFCQIQYNYLDENSQAGRLGLEEAEKLGVPVIIMEPLRGGKLVNQLPKSAIKVMEESERNWSKPEWSFRWLWNQKGVTVILSGMNSLDMVKENIAIASTAEADSFTEEDFETIDKVKKAIRENEKVGCTGCRYCMPCPKGVDIPGTFFHYNQTAIDGKASARSSYWQTMGLRKDPGFATQCVKCGLCESHCPQHIDIRNKLVEADKELRPWYMKIATTVARKFLFHE